MSDRPFRDYAIVEIVEVLISALARILALIMVLAWAVGVVLLLLTLVVLGIEALR